MTDWNRRATDPYGGVGGPGSNPGPTRLCRISDDCKRRERLKMVGPFLREAEAISYGRPERRIIQLADL
jgi:hypothetical protein